MKFPNTKKAVLYFMLAAASALSCYHSYNIRRDAERRLGLYELFSYEDIQKFQEDNSKLLVFQGNCGFCDDNFHKSNEDLASIIDDTPGLDMIVVNAELDHSIYGQFSIGCPAYLVFDRKGRMKGASEGAVQGNYGDNNTLEQLRFLERQVPHLDAEKSIKELKDNSS